jgi:NifB/MoaA-like Fe-S oxidoreductase
MAMMAPMAPMPPQRMYPDVDVPSFTPLSSRQGIVVEPMSPQLCDFFGVPQNKGVLVRSVEKGSPAAAGGIRAGDVIVRVNNETIHDMADFRRALKTRSGKITIAVVRDKREQTIELTLPANSSELKGGDWEGFEGDMQTMAQDLQKLGPEFAKNTQEMTMLAMLDPQEMDEINRQADTASKTASAEMKKQAEEMRKQADKIQKQADITIRTMTPEMKRQAEELRRQSAEMRKEAEKMRKEAEKMAPELAKSAKEISDAMKPTAREWAATARDMQQMVKDMQPQLKIDMEELKKELEQEKREWQEIFKGSDSRQHF